MVHFAAIITVEGVSQRLIQGAHEVLGMISHIRCLPEVDGQITPIPVVWDLMPSPSHGA